METLVYLLQALAATAAGLLAFYVIKFGVEAVTGKLRN